jgi:malonate decarboxylase epsilon subunit
MDLYPTGYGLSVIVGLSESQITKLVEVTNSQEAPVFVANINAPRQIVVAGSYVGLDRTLDEARRHGARKAVRLNVSGPLHCPLLQPVADFLARLIATLTLGTPQVTYVTNVKARAPRSKELVASDLANNIAHGVRWHDATQVLKELGCNLFLEMPRKNTLGDLAQQNLAGIISVPVERGALSRVSRLAQQELAST